MLSVLAIAKKGIKTVAKYDGIVLSRNGKVVAKAKLVRNTYLLKAVT